jgi:hypothetical protein
MALLIAGVDDDLQRVTDSMPSPVTYPPGAIPAGGLEALDGGFVLVDGLRGVPAYRPITRAPGGRGPVGCRRAAPRSRPGPRPANCGGGG